MSWNIKLEWRSHNKFGLWSPWLLCFAWFPALGKKVLWPGLIGCWLLWHLCLPIWLLVVMEPRSTNLVVSCYGTWVYQFGCLPHTHCSDAPSFCEVLTALHQSWRYRNNVVHIVYNVDMYKEVDNYRCLARCSPSTTTTNQPASRAQNESAWPQGWLKVHYNMRILIFKYEKIDL